MMSSGGVFQQEADILIHKSVQVKLNTIKLDLLPKGPYRKVDLW